MNLVSLVVFFFLKNRKKKKGKIRHRILVNSIISYISNRLTTLSITDTDQRKMGKGSVQVIHKRKNN